MKRKLLSILGCMVLMMVLLSLSVSAAYTLPEINKKDTVYRGKLTDVNTNTLIPFNYEVPENGATVIYFYKTTCGLSQYTLSSLNEQSWVRNDRIKFYAIESVGENGVEEIRAFQKEYTPNIADVITWLDSPSTFLCGDYLKTAGLYSGGWTWPVVMVITEENGVNTIRTASERATDVRLLGNTLELLLNEDLGIPKPVPIAVSVTKDYDKAAEMVPFINQRRTENGLEALHHNKTLTEAAMQRAAEAALFPSESRPDGTDSHKLLQVYMPNSSDLHCTVGYQCNTPEEFWEYYVEPINFDRWFHTEYEEIQLTQIGVGCVYYNNTYYWALATASDDRSATASADQSGTAENLYTVMTYLDCLPNPGLYPNELTLYPGNTAELKLYGNIGYVDTPLIPTVISNEIHDSRGSCIATAELQADGTIAITAKAVGTGRLQVWAWEGQQSPYTAQITVSDDTALRPNKLHTATEGSGEIRLNTDTAVKDQLISFSVIPNEGWWTASVYVRTADGKSVNCVFDQEYGYLFYMPASDVYITAQLLPDSVPQTRYSIGTDTIGNGSISVLNGSYTAYATTAVTVTAQGNSGHVLKSLTAKDNNGNAVALTDNGDGSYTFQMPVSNVTLYGIFAPAAGYSVKVDTAYCCTVSANPENADPGELVTVTIIPDAGYEIRDFHINLWEDKFAWSDENTVTFSMPQYDVEISVYCIQSAVTSGSFGDGLTWTYADGTLIVSGKGSMGDFNNTFDLPWDDCRDEIQSVVIENGVTNISAHAFSHLKNLTAVSIPASVEHIDTWAFLSSKNLTRITFAAVPAGGIENGAFADVTAEVIVPDDDFSWTDEVTLDYGGDLTWNHSWSKSVMAPTCTEGGYTEYSCICGDSRITDETPALDHDYTDGICSRCDAADPDYVKPEPITNPFEDVSEEDYFYTPVLWAVERNVTTGTSPTTFSPNADCTRGQVVTFLWRAMGEPRPASSTNPFTDVHEGDYFYTAVLWAVEQGITNGTSPSTFGSNDICSRAQVATFLWRTMGKPAPTSSNNPFVDVAAGQYYYDAVLWAVEQGVTNGTSPSTFGPDVNCNRGQIVTFLYRALQ